MGKTLTVEPSTRRLENFRAGPYAALIDGAVEKMGKTKTEFYHELLRRHFAEELMPGEVVDALAAIATVNSTTVPAILSALIRGYQADILELLLNKLKPEGAPDDGKEEEVKDRKRRSRRA